LTIEYKSTPLTTPEPIWLALAWGDITRDLTL